MSSVPIDLNNLTLTINFDIYADEISWDIKNTATNAIVANGGSYTRGSSPYTTTVSISLPNGSYTFTMKDTYGDGLCSGGYCGSYELKLNSTNQVLVSGTGNFGTQKADNFSLSGGTDPCAGNTAPSVSITAPANGTTYTVGQTITVTANATDNGTITNVEFYNGATYLGNVATSPYSFSFTPSVAQTYSLIAKAIDNCAASTNSATISVTVNSSTGGGGTLCTNIYTNCTTGQMAFGLNSYGTDSYYKLLVKGGIRTEKVKVELAATGGWSDYVFEPNYKLSPLKTVEAFVKKNKHLPNKGFPIKKEQGRKSI